MSAGRAGRADTETLACCYLDPLCSWWSEASSSTSVFYTVFSNIFMIFCLYVFMLPSDSSPPPLAPFDHRIVTPKPHQIATYYTINRDEVLGGWVRRVNHSSQAYFYSHSHFYTSVVSNEITEDLTPCEGTPNRFFSKTLLLPPKGQMIVSPRGELAK